MDPAVDMKGITMRFGKVVANDKVNFSVEKGEILALVGENGAGKSTLMNILYGLYIPTDGTIHINGEKKIFHSAIDAMAAGVGMVHQHFMLVDSLTGAENMMLGLDKTGFVSNKKRDIQITDEVAKKYNFEIDASRRVRDMSVGMKQKLENLLVKNFSKCKVNDRIKTENSQGKILQICHSDGNVKVDSTRIVENGIETEGVVRVRILYIVSDDEMPFYAMETMIPFTHVIEAKGINEQCVYHLRTDLEQLSTTMIDSDEIEVKIVMNLNALVMNQMEMGIIREIEERELDREKLKSMPGIVGYQVQQGDTLWDIAKKFYTTIENIMELNGLESEEVKPGDGLLLMKKVER